MIRTISPLGIKHCANVHPIQRDHPSQGIEHLAKTVFPDTNWRVVNFAMFTACFDASGHESDKPYLVVAGFISSADDWINFSEKWKMRLNQDGLPYFRMSEYAHSRRVFEGWRNQEAKRRSLLADLIDLIKSHAYRQYGCVIDIKSFLQILPKEHRNTYHLNAYSLAARDCAAQIRKWAKSENITSPIKFVFEDGDKGTGQLIQRFGEDNLPSPDFAPKKDTIKNGITVPGFIPLQAADIWAYELFLAFKRYNEGNTTPPPVEFRATSTHGRLCGCLHYDGT